MIIPWDSETAIIRPGLKLPPLVCVSTPDVVVHASEATEFMLSRFDLGGVLVAHNAAFDAAVLGTHEPWLLPKIFSLYDNDRIACTQTRQMLIDNAAGRLRAWVKNEEGKNERLAYNLAAVAKRTIGVHIEKEDTWRLRYAELLPYPVAQWPQDAVSYALKDAWAHGAVWQWQERYPECLVDQYRQARASFWLTLMSAWGFHTDARQVRALADAAGSEQRRLLDILVREGLVRAPRQLKSGKNKGQWTEPTRDTKAAMARLVAAYARQGIPHPTTPTLEPQIDEPACRDSKDPVLVAYSEYSSIDARLSKDVPMLEAGINVPIQTRYDHFKENGRTGSSAPNVQNWPKEAGDERPKEGPTVRECAVPRQGYVFAAADYEQMELHTLAQVCLKLIGYSKLAEALNAHRDPHLELAAQIIGVSVQEATQRLEAGDPEIKAARQHSKPPNFGLPGGLGVKRLIELAKNDYKLVFSPAQAQILKQAWFERWPEMRPYLDLIGRLCENGPAQIEQLFSGRLRGGLGYCDAANTFFSGLAQDAAKEAGWWIARACYIEPNSVLWGSRPVIFGHDEFILEVPEYKAHECTTELARIMVETGKRWLPDVHPKATPLLMRCWSKEAKPVKDTNGRLIPWDPSMLPPRKVKVAA